MLGKKNRVTIIVPVYGDIDTLLECIDSLKFFIKKKHTILLINDCGPDADYIESQIQASIGKLKNFIYFRNTHNLGFVQTCNRAVFELDKSDNDILLLNSDTRTTKGFLEEMQRVMISDESVVAVSPRSNHATVFSIPFEAAARYDYPEDYSYRIFQKIRKHLPVYYVAPTVHGFCVLLRRDIISKYGLFDEVYGRGYGEENDFSMRIRNKGYKCAIANRAFVFHHGSKSFTPKGRDELVERNTKTLLQRYPQYNELVDEYVHNIVIPEQELLKKYLANTI